MKIPDEKAARARDGQRINQRRNPTTGSAFRASNRRPLTSLTSKQRGPFWASVGELIEQARRAAQ
ncbi:MAG: hypothetical protein BWX54_00389 [Verrucomicrobia bacterium ADurb.Bin018]|jgi:hypothetical protein|nr:MAG: hypothetical protein BWX54_00389 [Verrucomicrobia bacterium ADurb.Bin018]